MSASLQYELTSGPPPQEDPGVAALEVKARALGFRRAFGVRCWQAGPPAPRFVDDNDNLLMDQLRREGETSTLLLSRSGTAVVELSDYFGQPHARFRSLLADGTVIETAMSPSRQPDVTTAEEGRPPSWETATEAGLDDTDAFVDWHTRRLIDWLLGKTPERFWLDRPRAGLHRLPVRAELDALWARHQERVSALSSAPRELHPELVVAMSRRVGHILRVEVETSVRAFQLFQLGTHLVGAGGVLLLAAVHPSWWSLAPAAVFGLAWWGMGRDLLAVAFPYRIGAPVLKHLATPAVVPASELESTYPG